MKMRNMEMTTETVKSLSFCFTRKQLSNYGQMGVIVGQI